jgi:uncharacterized repeat protein (TIGR01451 family)
VTGSLKFNGGGTNFFDPNSGFVPATGYENSSTFSNSTTVPVTSGPVEFGFNDGANLITADFDGATLVLQDVASNAAGGSAQTYVFTDPAFSGLAVTKTGDTFPGGGLSASLVGTMLTITDAGFGGAGTFTGTFRLAAATFEPASDFGASVNWGDGTTDPATVVSDGGGSYHLDIPDHTYLDEGDYNLSVTVTHDALSPVTSNTQVFHVADRQIINLVLASPGVNPVEGSIFGPFAGIATFTDPAGGYTVPTTVNGSSVTGSLQFNGGGTNFFDPNQGFVPATGYENSSTAFNSATVPVASGPVEFGFNDGANLITADFDGATLVLQDISSTSSGGAPQTYVFTDPAFSGLAVTKTGDTFPGGGLSASLVGTTLTITVGAFSGAGTRTGTFSLSPTSTEPASSFIASVNWGDSTTSPATVVSDGGGSYHVNIPGHTYLDEGDYNLSVTVTHDALPPVTSNLVALHVDEAQITNLTGAGVTQSLVLGGDTTAITGLATFTDPAGAEPNAADPTGTPDTHYTTTINWGDGTTSPGTVVITGATTLRVDAPAHTYAMAGNYSVTVGVTHETAPQLTVTAASITITPKANLSITTDDGVTAAVPGGSVTYTITVSNNGPSDITGATVADTFPAILTGVSWTAVGAGGGTPGVMSGNGDISDVVNLPAGGSVTYTVSATINAAATGTLSNTATVTAPAGVTDPAPGNESATDTDSRGTGRTRPTPR